MSSSIDLESYRPLTGLRVALSGAVPEAKFWEQPALDQRIRDFVSEFCGSVFKLGGHIVHGNHPSFRPMIVRQAERFLEDHSGERPLTLVASLLWEEGKEDAFRKANEPVARIVFTPKLGTGDPNDPATRKLSLTALRLALIEQSDAFVAVGGKLHEETGFAPGVLQELTIARWNHLPCYVIAGLGGQAGALDKEVVRRLCDESGLDPESLLALAETKDVTNTVGKLIRHLIWHQESRSSATRPAERAEWHYKTPAASVVKLDSTGGPLSLSEQAVAAVHDSAKQFDKVLDAVNNSDIAGFHKLLAR